MITRHKIVLVGESAPQNRSCGVVVPPQTRSCSGIERKHEHEREGKSINYFFLFMNLKQEQEQTEWREVEHEGNHLQLGLGQQEKAMCASFYRGEPPHGRPAPFWCQF